MTNDYYMPNNVSNDEYMDFKTKTSADSLNRNDNDNFISHYYYSLPFRLIALRCI